MAIQTISTATHPLRSLLFCPATESRMVAKLPRIGADAVAIDLEDAVTNARKSDARQELRAALEDFSSVRTYVRVNHPSTGRTMADIQAIVHPALDGIVLPKVEDPQTVADAGQWLTAAEQEHGVPVGQTTMLVLLESARGVHNAVSILRASERVETAIFGFVDFMLDVGIDVIDHSPGTEELLYARSSIVVAARVAGRRQPLDGPFIDINNDDGFFKQCRQARRLGFGGKMLIHPKQVELAHRAFRPSEEEVAAARRILDAFEAAEREGVAAIVVDGRLVDYPVASRARRIVEAGRS